MPQNALFKKGGNEMDHRSIKERLSRLSPAQLQEIALFVDLLDGSRRLPPAKHKLFLEYVECNDHTHIHELLKEEIAISA